MSNKIIFKITLMFLLISFISISIVSFISINTARKSLKQSISSNFTYIVAEKSNAISYTFNEKIEEASNLASIQEVMDTLKIANRNKMNKRDIDRIDK